ncbi:MAG: hypothetical protein ACRD6X_21260 [Pyrinomonadaceae bacterium]
MTLVLELDNKIEELLLRRALESGVEVNGYVRSLIEQDSKQKSLDERLAPLRNSFEESGMTEDELDEFMNGVRSTIHAERAAVRSS